MNKKSLSGFTVVELLIVIVVIGILATIVGVSYSGAVARSKSNAAQISANVLSKKLENYYSGTGTYPTDSTVSAFTTTLNSRPDSSIANANITLVAPSALSAGNGQGSVGVSVCSSPAGTAYRIDYWDYTTNHLSTSPVMGSAGTTTCTSWQAVS